MRADIKLLIPALVVSLAQVHGEDKPPWYPLSVGSVNDIAKNKQLELLAVEQGNFANMLGGENNDSSVLKQQQAIAAQLALLEKQIGEKTRGSIDSKNPALDAALQEQIKQLDELQKARTGLEQSTIDIYLSRAKEWVARLVAFRAKAEALSNDVNGRQLNFVEWMIMEGRFRLLMSEIVASETTIRDEQNQLVTRMVTENGQAWSERFQREERDRAIQQAHIR